MSVTAFQRLTGVDGAPEIVAAVRAVAATPSDAGPQRLLDALTVLRWAQAQLAAMEPELITAARAAGVLWQARLSMMT